MSELITAEPRTDKRLQLLATASALALLTIATTQAKAEDADRPTVWIEGGWHFDSITGSNDVLAPPLDELTARGFSSKPTAANFYGQSAGHFTSFTEMLKAQGRSEGAEGSISFQPQGSDWVLKLGAKYGRSHTERRRNERKVVDGYPGYVKNFATGTGIKTPHATVFAIQANENKRAHIVVDFEVGKDIGIGLFGGMTVLSAGIRYAQMNGSSKGHSYASPDVRFYAYGGFSPVFLKYQRVINPERHRSTTLQNRSNSFHGIGPSVSWSNTTGLVGDVADGQLALDWGANAALLFGRQKAKVDYSTVSGFYHFVGFNQVATKQQNAFNRTQSRRVTVPNLGGFAALSYRFTNAKISAGYRADFFLGAMDGGLDTHKSITTGFHGPFAKISVGLGG